MLAYPDILELIPQRPPFVMVDRLEEVTGEKTVTTFLVTDANVFTENGEFYEGGIIENIAQTAAAGVGFKQKLNNEKPKLGVIGAVKKLTINRRAKTGEKIYTEVNSISAFENAIIVEGSCKVKGTIIAECQLNVFIVN